MVEHIAHNGTYVGSSPTKLIYKIIMIHLYNNNNLRYMRNKKDTWISSFLFYQINTQEVLVKHFTKTFGQQLTLKKLNLKKKDLIYQQNFKFWFNNKKSAIDFNKSNLCF